MIEKSEEQKNLVQPDEKIAAGEIYLEKVKESDHMRLARLISRLLKQDPHSTT